MRVENWAGVEPADRTDAAPAFTEALPGFLGSRAQRGNQTHAGNNNSSLLQNLQPRLTARTWADALRCKLSASLTVVIFSASSSGISMPNPSSRAITSSTVSSESAPRSSMKEAVGVTSDSSTPSCSTIICLTFSSVEEAILNLLIRTYSGPASEQIA